MLEYCCSASERPSFDEYFVSLNANNGLSDCGVESIDHLLSCLVVIEWVLVLCEI